MTAIIIFTDHADYDDSERIKALCYGTSDESSKDYGKKGFIGHGLTFTKSVFAKTKAPFPQEKIQELLRVYGKIPSVRNRFNWQVFDEERRLSKEVPGLDKTSFNKLMSAINKKGIEICPHCLYWEGVERTEAKKLFSLFKKFKPKTWIDHGQKYCKNALFSEGAVDSSKYYILDFLRKGGYKYAWAYEDLEYPGELDISSKDSNYLFYSPSKKLLFFKTIELKPSEFDFRKVYSKENIDKLISSGGIHISHVYFSQPIFEKPRKRFHLKGERFLWYIINFIKWKVLRMQYKRRKEKSNSVLVHNGKDYEIDPIFDSCLKYMGEKQKEGKLLVTTIKGFLGGKDERVRKVLSRT